MIFVVSVNTVLNKLSNDRQFETPWRLFDVAVMFIGIESTHDDVIKWKHFPRYWPFVRGIHRSPMNSTHKGQWREALMLSLICVWINAWVNNRHAGDLRRYRAHYDVIVMVSYIELPVSYNAGKGRGVFCVWGMNLKCLWFLKNQHRPIGRSLLNFKEDMTYFTGCGRCWDLDECQRASYILWPSNLSSNVLYTYIYIWDIHLRAISQ